MIEYLLGCAFLGMCFGLAEEKTKTSLYFWAAYTIFYVLVREGWICPLC